MVLWPLFIGAEENKPLIGLVPFTIEGIGVEEAQIIESLIHSYITGLGEVIRSFDASLMMLPASKADAAYTTTAGMARFPDYTLSGSINLEGDRHILMLEIRQTRTGEKVNYTSVHKTTSELVLKAKSLVEAAFSAGSEPVLSREASPELLTERGILGTWRGDAGLELVRLQRGGAGTAILSSGVQMALEYSIENNTLRVIQSSPNTERFYHPLPYGVAKQLVPQAEPMKWEFSLYAGGTALRGIKTATAVRYERDTIIELLPASSREAEWVKVSR
ncbi:MAG: hypothetical protein LBP93_02940 [Treponema sp.]|nr:hypothetical protein [Treponema sp.]